LHRGDAYQLLLTAVAAFTAAVAAIGALAILAIGAATAFFTVANFAAAAPGFGDVGGARRRSQPERPGGSGQYCSHQILRHDQVSNASSNTRGFVETKETVFRTR
jgi:hypothetical protein